MFKTGLEWIYRYLLNLPQVNTELEAELWRMDRGEVKGVIEGVIYTGAPLPGDFEIKALTVTAMACPTIEEEDANRVAREAREKWIAENQKLPPLTEDSLKYHSFGPKWDPQPGDD